MLRSAELPNQAPSCQPPEATHCLSLRMLPACSSASCTSSAPSTPGPRHSCSTH